ncbi:MAG TPA: S26 family signal peptidase, partial [Rhodopila sp.]|nr:S26 family signal peptidase [Rhodopila sp.]
MEEFARQYARAAFERWEAGEAPPGRTGRRLVRRLAAGATLATGCLVVGAWQAGLYWNATPSMPEGLWRVAVLHGPPARGAVVTFCADKAVARVAVARGYLEPGPCAGGAEALLKPVVAVPGDVVTVNAFGMTVDG